MLKGKEGGLALVMLMTKVLVSFQALLISFTAGKRAGGSMRRKVREASTSGL